MKFLTHIINAHITSTTILFLLGMNSEISDHIAKFEKAFKSIPVKVIMAEASERELVIYKKIRCKAWYNVMVDHTVIYEDEKSLEDARKSIMKFIDEQGIDSDNLILSGLSQGGALALYTGGLSPTKYKAVIGLNTYLSYYLLKNCTQKQDIIMLNGRNDKVFPLSDIKMLIKYYRWRYGKIYHFICDGKHRICMEKLVYLINIVLTDSIDSYSYNESLELF